ncbi:MAG: hypothetical protein MMC33_001098 [Icmadophila ericetorum]|nr:hypothetical protein [Icmadophila ericetorum]
MAASIYPDYPPKLSPEQLDYLVLSLKDWSITNGLAVRPSPTFVSNRTDPFGVLAVTAPVTLFPSPFPRSCFEEALAIQLAYNELYAAISRDEDWLREIVQELLQVDDFIAKLWEIHVAVKREGYVQDLSLGLFRSDYMVHVDPSKPTSPPQIRQVEFNTIASSFGGLSTRVSQLHKHLLSTSAYPPTPTINPYSLPANGSISGLASGLFAAHSSYGPSKSTPPLPLCVLFIVQSPERNIFDQRLLEYELITNHQIPTFRLPFASALTHTSIPPNSSRPLIYAPPHMPHTSHEVSVLYFRSAYTPTDYPSPASWSARLHLERSAAIKCPSILTHLAGSKKVQQVLATPQSPHLSRFIRDPTICERVWNTFAAIYPLDDTPASKEAKRLATDEEECKKYVLKPQREGGGNNIYRTSIPPFLRSLPSEQHWKGHILMELIEPPALSNSIFREGVLKTGEVIGELGVYGTCLWRADGEVLMNKEAGYLLRTKGRESEEGGVAAGFGCVDSVCLINV